MAEAIKAFGNVGPLRHLETLDAFRDEFDDLKNLDNSPLTMSLAEAQLRDDIRLGIEHCCRCSTVFENNINNVAAWRQFDDLPQQHWLPLVGTMQDHIDKLLMEIQRAKFTERRTEPRQPFARPVIIHLPHGPSIRAFSKDLSAQGIGVITETQFQPNSLATLEIHSMNGDPVLLRSEVRWCDGYGKGWFLVGWKFMGIGNRPVP